jgi:hypothetical protein
VTALTYGHRHLWFLFRPVLETTDRGFRYRGIDYSWGQVASVSIWKASPFLNAGTARERATITLSDGNRIHLNCRALEKLGDRPRVGFFTTRTDAYDELLARFRAVPPNKSLERTREG